MCQPQSWEESRTKMGMTVSSNLGFLRWNNVTSKWLTSCRNLGTVPANNLAWLPLQPRRFIFRGNSECQLFSGSASLSLQFWGGKKTQKRFKGIQLQLRLMLVWHYFGLAGGASFVWGEVWHSGCDLLQRDDCRDVRERLRVGGSCLEFILFPKSWLKIWLIPSA